MVNLAAKSSDDKLIEVRTAVAQKMLGVVVAVLPLGVALVLLRRRAQTPWASAAALGTLMELSGFHELVFASGDARLQSVLGPVGGGLVLLGVAAYAARTGREAFAAPADAAS